MEIMDGPAIAAVEEFVHAGYPLDVEALLIVELDGPRCRGRPSDRSASKRSREIASSLVQSVAFGTGAAAVLGRAKGGISGGRPDLARLLLHGWDNPACAAAAGAQAHERDVGQIRSACRKRISRRRRQPASAYPLRCQSALANLRRPKNSAPKFSSYASKSAAFLPASTASVSKSAT